MSEAALTWSGIADVPAVEARRPAVTAEITDAATVDAQDWDRLLADAAEPNPFYSESFMSAALNTIDRQSGIEVCVFRNGGDALVGLLPFRRSRIGPFRSHVAAANRYQFNGTPLVEQHALGDVIHVLMDMLSTSRSLRTPWLFRNVAEDGPFVSQLVRRARETGWRIEPIRRYRRPILSHAAESFEGYLAKCLSRKRQKDIARTTRRLEGLGDVRFERVSDPESVARRLEDFLALEHAGWKGRAGTSFRSNEQHERFLRASLRTTDGAAAQPVIDSLLLDGKPIAVSINLFSGRKAFTPKCAFDEKFRQYGPGLILEYLVIKAFYEERDLDEMDSAIVADGHVVGGLWNGSRAMADMLLVPDTIAGRTLLRALQLRRKAIESYPSIKQKFGRRIRGFGFAKAASS